MITTHAPLVAAMVPGVVTLRLDDAGNEQRLAVGAGFVEVSDNVVNVMTDTCELGDAVECHDLVHARSRHEQAPERTILCDEGRYRTELEP